jgi:hypothetical protein
MHVHVSNLITRHAQAWSHLWTTYALVKKDNGEIADIVLDCASGTCFFEGKWRKMSIDPAGDYESIIWIWD